MSDGIANLSTYEREQMLRFLLYHMGQEMRAKLMYAQPLAYNRLCGREIMIVRRASDDTPAS